MATKCSSKLGMRPNNMSSKERGVRSKDKCRSGFSLREIGLLLSLRSKLLPAFFYLFNSYHFSRKNESLITSDLFCKIC